MQVRVRSASVSVSLSLNGSVSEYIASRFVLQFVAMLRGHLEIRL